MKIDFRKPRYVIPLILLPFLCVFFYAYKSSFGKELPVQAGKDSLQTNLVGVSDQIRKSTLSDKLESYRNQYKQSDGYTAIGHIQEEQPTEEKLGTLYNDREKRMLDSIEHEIKNRYSTGPKRSFPDVAPRPHPYDPNEQDRALAEAIASVKQPYHRVVTDPQKRDPDPMELFRKQMELVDSMGKANDPDYKQQQQLKKSREPEKEDQPRHILSVNKAPSSLAVFNTIKPRVEETFITAIVDQDIKGYAGSRLRIRLLEDMMAGRFLIKRGTYIYALISGFSGQRVNLSITSIMNGQHILPVKLDVYDQDGLPGLYVPASAFREFTKELGGNASQGITLQQMAENNSQLMMSMVQKMFQSTSTALNKMIRQNKAKIKYNTLVYLIDPQQLKNNPKNY
ncbi:conjugative transposon protein TraM [Sphingobacterium sp. ML3W]|uniref:conjugative transposon protein TraM n=1 Tax=Sphingobacterium sp. ML3W TaxID=1538644 RepID=UPI00249CE876|nr:conjugative transposon protein TraM [Sphingobacterium sp. ML3W]WFA81409.1 conjugative transposon protein TraM [Sphingobacterium sp. ML3W]